MLVLAKNNFSIPIFTRFDEKLSIKKELFEFELRNFEKGKKLFVLEK